MKAEEERRDIVEIVSSAFTTVRLPASIRTFSRLPVDRLSATTTWVWGTLIKPRVRALPIFPAPPVTRIDFVIIPTSTEHLIDRRNLRPFAKRHLRFRHPVCQCFTSLES